MSPSSCSAMILCVSRVSGTCKLRKSHFGRRSLRAKEGSVTPMPFAIASLLSDDDPLPPSPSDEGGLRSFAIITFIPNATANLASYAARRIRYFCKPSSRNMSRNPAFVRVDSRYIIDALASLTIGREPMRARQVRETHEEREAKAHAGHVGYIPRTSWKCLRWTNV